MGAEGGNMVTLIPTRDPWPCKARAAVVSGQALQALPASLRVVPSLRLAVVSGFGTSHRWRFAMKV